MSEAPRTAGIILAAGASTRMGTNKMFLEVDGVPLIRGAILRAQMAALDPIVLVLGHDAERARTAVRDFGCEIAFNPDYAGPTSGSLHAGLNKLSPTATRAVVMLADMLHTTPAMIRTIVRRANETNAPLVVSRYGDVTAPPILYRRELFPELLAWTGEGCGKSVVQRHSGNAAFVDWPVEALADVDTPEDWDRQNA